MDPKYKKHNWKKQKQSRVLVDTNVIDQEFLRGLPDLCLRILPLSTTRNHGPPLESRRGAVEDEHWLRAEEKQLAYPPEEP